MSQADLCTRLTRHRTRQWSSTSLVRRAGVRSPWSSMIRLRSGAYPPIGNHPGPVVSNDDALVHHCRSVIARTGAAHLTSKATAPQQQRSAVWLLRVSNCSLTSRVNARSRSKESSPAIASFFLAPGL